MTDKVPLHEKDWDEMDKKERYQYTTSFEVISRMRTRSWSLSEACKNYNIVPEVVLDAVAPAFRKIKGGWTVKKDDDLVRPPMQIISTTERKLTTITVKGYRAAHMIGQYWRAVDIWVNQGDASALQAFKGVTITDVNGNNYTLETDTEAIMEVLEKTREPDYPEPYKP